MFFASLTNPEIIGGDHYFIQMTTQLSTGYYAWNLNDQGAEGNTMFNAPFQGWFTGTGNPDVAFEVTVIGEAPQTAPEPATLVLVASGLGVFGAVRMRHRS